MKFPRRGGIFCGQDTPQSRRGRCHWTGAGVWRKGTSTQSTLGLLDGSLWRELRLRLSEWSGPIPQMLGQETKNSALVLFRPEGVKVDVGCALDSPEFFRLDC